MPAQTKGTMMAARRKIPAFRTDREAANYWATHDSSGYAKGLPAAAVKVAPALRRRVVARAKRPVTLRLEERQIAAAKRAAARRSLPYQTLLRMWIAERLAQERAGTRRPTADERLRSVIRPADPNGTTRHADRNAAGAHRSPSGPSQEHHAHALLRSSVCLSASELPPRGAAGCRARSAGPSTANRGRPRILAGFRHTPLHFAATRRPLTHEHPPCAQGSITCSVREFQDITRQMGRLARGLVQAKVPWALAARVTSPLDIQAQCERNDSELDLVRERIRRRACVPAFSLVIGAPDRQRVRGLRSLL
jgi:hypothetical protein